MLWRKALEKRNGRRRSVLRRDRVVREELRWKGGKTRWTPGSVGHAAKGDEGDPAHHRLAGDRRRFHVARDRHLVVGRRDLRPCGDTALRRHPCIGHITAEHGSELWT